MREEDDPDLKTEELESVFITSTEQEKFECFIPKVSCKLIEYPPVTSHSPQASQLKKFEGENYSGKTVFQLMESIFVQQSCAYR